MAIPAAKLWWPDAPFLYDLRITLKQGGVAGDEVASYFGMRKISIGPDAKGLTRMLLNNQFGISVVIPNAPWLDPAIRARLMDNL